MDNYIAPEPTTEQKILAKYLGIDPYDRIGSCPWWALAANDTFAAAATIHDELYMIGGTKEEQKRVDKNFCRDCDILWRPIEGLGLLIFERAKANAFSLAIELGVGNNYWPEKDRNTLITRAQGESFIIEAKLWVNQCALKVKYDYLPYPEMSHS